MCCPELTLANTTTPKDSDRPQRLTGAPMFRSRRMVADPEPTTWTRLVRPPASRTRLAGCTSRDTIPLLVRTYLNISNRQLSPIPKCLKFTINHATVSATAQSSQYRNDLGDLNATDQKCRFRFAKVSVRTLSPESSRRSRADTLGFWFRD